MNYLDAKQGNVVMAKADKFLVPVGTFGIIIKLAKSHLDVSWVLPHCRMVNEDISNEDCEFLEFCGPVALNTLLETSEEMVKFHYKTVVETMRGTDHIPETVSVLSKVNGNHVAFVMPCSSYNRKQVINFARMWRILERLQGIVLTHEITMSKPGMVNDLLDYGIIKASQDPDTKSVLFIYALDGMCNYNIGAWELTTVNEQKEVKEPLRMGSALGSWLFEVFKEGEEDVTEVQL